MIMNEALACWPSPRASSLPQLSPLIDPKITGRNNNSNQFFRNTQTQLDDENRNPRSLFWLRAWQNSLKIHLLVQFNLVCDREWLRSLISSAALVGESLSLALESF